MPRTVALTDRQQSRTTEPIRVAYLRGSGQAVGCVVPTDQAANVVAHSVQVIGGASHVWGTLLRGELGKLQALQGRKQAA